MNRFHIETLVFWGIWIGWAGVIGGCSRQFGDTMSSPEGQAAATLAVEGYGRVDSAHVFFFRKFADRDSLVLQEMIYDVSTTPRRFDFNLPLGYYMVFVLGNAATDRIEYRAPYSSDSIFVNYQGHPDVPAIYWGRTYVDVGVDTLRMSGMFLFTSAVEVTIRNVPVSVKQIRVEITNTCSGVSFQPAWREEVMDPPVFKTINDTKTDSTYVVELSSFSSPGKDGQSRIIVSCYDENGVLLYAGQSVSFPAQYGRRRVVACSFGSASKTKTALPDKQGMIRLTWKYDEEPI